MFCRRCYSVLLAVLLLLGAVTVHEGGHGLCALAVGVPVRELGLGVGPPLARARVRGLALSLRAFPVGALVDLDDDAYYRLSAGRRVLLALAGPAANAAAAFLALFCLGLWWGRDGGLRAPVFAAAFAWGVLVEVVRLSLRPGHAELVGPVGFVAAVRDLGPVGVAEGVLLFSLLSLGLGAVNLLPVFPLDGGRAFVEAFSGRLRPTWRRGLERFGWAAVVGLALLVLAADLCRL